MAPLFLEFAADRGEVATDAPELRASDRASLEFALATVSTPLEVGR